MKEQYRYDKMKFVWVDDWTDRLPGLLLAIGMLVLVFGPFIFD